MNNNIGRKRVSLFSMTGNEFLLSDEGRFIWSCEGLWLPEVSHGGHQDPGGEERRGEERGRRMQSEFLLSSLLAEEGRQRGAERTSDTGDRFVSVLTPSLVRSEMQ